MPNENLYNLVIKPMLAERDIQPAQVFQFPLILPFVFPFPNLSTATFKLSNGDGCTITINKVTSQVQVHAGVVSEGQNTSSRFNGLRCFILLLKNL